MPVTLADLQTTPRNISREIRCSGPPGIGNAPGNIAIRSMAGGQVQNEQILLVTVPTASLAATAAVADNPDHVGVTVAAGGGANCLWLPWGDGRAYLTTLNTSQTCFFTPTLNGCAFLVGGTQAAPTVVHANANLARLDAAVVMGDPAGTARRQSEIYGHFYRHVLATLVSRGDMPAQNTAMLLPETYLGADRGRGAVFGICQGGNWQFYWNCRRRTKRFWPNFEA